MGDLFGFSVAISGDTVVVGADNADPGGIGAAGAAYVFVKPGGGWAGNLTQTAKLTASDKAAADLFGCSVAISGDTVVVGAALANPGGTEDAGAAYVFVKPGGGWAGNLTENAKLTASDKAANDHFGGSVAISGDTVVVGAVFATSGSTADAGAAYVFIKPGGGWAGNLTQNVKLTAYDKAAYDSFGCSVAISGDTVVVGASDARPGGTAYAGAAYVFVKPGGGWAGNLTQNAKLTASDKATYDRFGHSVGISGDTVVVGANDTDPSNTTDAEAAYVFVKPGGGWAGSLPEYAKLTASDKAGGDGFGNSVAISGDTVVVGADRADPGGTVNAGAVYAFPSGTTTTITSHTPNPSVVGQAVTANYTVTPDIAGSRTPTGNVTVSDGTVSCIATVAAGTCNLTFSSAGGKTLIATYAGNSSFTGSASTGVGHMVNQANTTTTITSNTPHPSVVGQAVAVNYSVAVTAPGSGTPTGIVTVSDGTISCTATVAAGTCNLTFTTAVGKTLIATYAGDSNFNGSASTGVGHTVTPAYYLPLILK